MRVCVTMSPSRYHGYSLPVHPDYRHLQFRVLQFTVKRYFSTHTHKTKVCLFLSLKEVESTMLADMTVPDSHLDIISKVLSEQYAVLLLSSRPPDSTDKISNFTFKINVKQTWFKLNRNKIKLTKTVILLFQQESPTLTELAVCSHYLYIQLGKELFLSSWFSALKPVSWKVSWTVQDCRSDTDQCCVDADCPCMLPEDLSLWFLLLCFILLMSLKAANCPRLNWTINSQSLLTLPFHLVGLKSNVACGTSGHGGDRKTAPFRWRDGKHKWVLREVSVLEGLEKTRQLLFGWLHPKQQHHPVYGKKRRG